MKISLFAIAALSASPVFGSEGHFLVTGTDPLGHAYSVEMTMIENGDAKLLTFHYDEPITATAVGDHELSIAAVHDGQPAASLMRKSEDGSWSGEWVYGNNSETGIETWTPISASEREMIMRMRIENDFGDLDGLLSLIAGLPPAGNEGMDAWVKATMSAPFRIGTDYVEDMDVAKIASAYALVAPAEKVSVQDLSILGNEVLFADGKINFIRSCVTQDCNALIWSISALNP